MKTPKNPNEEKGECYVIGHASFKDGKISYPKKPKTIWDELY